MPHTHSSHSDAAQTHHADGRITSPRKRHDSKSSPEEDARRETLALVKEMMDPYWSWRFVHANRG